MGLPNSDASLVQSTLTHHHSALLDDGVLFPADEELLFRACLDVRGDHQEWGHRRADVAGAWDRLCLLARGHHGTTIISHELLAAAPKRKVASALSMLAGLEVHLVVTARDLVRQMVVQWRESVADGGSTDLEEFHDQIFSPAPTPEQQRFWTSQDLPEVLARWGADLPPENIHVVCCPPSNEPAGHLWARLAEVIELDPTVFPVPDHAPPAPSMGGAQIDLLRRVNAGLTARGVDARGIAKQFFSPALPAQHPSSPPELPVGLLDDAVTVAKRWVGELHTAGYHTHGDPSDLAPALVSGAQQGPEGVDRAAEVDIAVTVLVELLLEVDRLRSHSTGLESENKKLKKKRKKLKLRLAEAVKG